MHSEEREVTILAALQRTGFVTYRDLEAALDASPATIRRDLARLEAANKLKRVHGGAKLAGDVAAEQQPTGLEGTPFGTALEQNLAAKRQIGKAAAALCEPGDGIIIDGGTTTFQMCEHLAGLGLQVLTNSLHIVNALLPQEGTRILVPSGAIFREQNIILAPIGEPSMPDFHARKLFLGASAVSPKGLFQPDALLVASQRRLLDRADEIVLLVDSTKLLKSYGAIVCGLDRIDMLVTDRQASPEMLDRLRQAGLTNIILA